MVGLVIAWAVISPVFLGLWMWQISGQLEQIIEGGEDEMGNIIVQAFLKYIESNPKVIEDLVAKLIPVIVDAILHQAKSAQS